MINLSMVSKIMDKLYLGKATNFILAKRFCSKHLKEFVEKNKIPLTDEITVNQLCGICSKCKKGGIVYYLDIPDKLNLSPHT
jgi:hypothetical protein